MLIRVHGVDENNKLLDFKISLAKSGLTWSDTSSPEDSKGFICFVRENALSLSFRGKSPAFRADHRIRLLSAHGFMLIWSKQRLPLQARV